MRVKSPTRVADGARKTACSGRVVLFFSPAYMGRFGLME